MTNEELLKSVKNAMGITGEYQDDTLKEYIKEVEGFLTDAGVEKEKVTPGIVARGVADLWNYGAGEAKLSTYFMQRATQLAYKGGTGNGTV